VNTEDFERLAEDLRRHAGLAVEFLPDSDPEGLHILRINHVDFFFNADGSGYDGWGKQIAPPHVKP
jgi:hypothetical protein